jgi:hypothetical protein
VAIFALFLTCSAAIADQITLKNGHEYTGKFVRGDANVVEFRILGRVETFKTAEVAQIIFKEPEMVNPPSGKVPSTVPDSGEPGRVSAGGNAPAERDLSSTSSVGPAPQSSGRGATVTLPAGTDITIRMVDSVDTDRNQVGDAFQATLQDPLSVGSQVVVPRGASVRGTIAYSKESGRVTGQSELILELTELAFDGRTYPLRTSDYQEVGSSRGARTAKAAGGTAALGAIIGAIAGGGKGAAVGAVTGGAVGTGVAVMSRGQTIKVPAETLLDFKLQKPLSVEMP